MTALHINVAAAVAFGGQLDGAELAAAELGAAAALFVPSLSTPASEPPLENLGNFIPYKSPMEFFLRK